MYSSATQSLHIGLKNATQRGELKNGQRWAFRVLNTVAWQQKVIRMVSVPVKGLTDPSFHFKTLSPKVRKGYQLNLCNYINILYTVLIFDDLNNIYYCFVFSHPPITQPLKQPKILTIKRE